MALHRSREFETCARDLGPTDHQLETCARDLGPTGLELENAPRNGCRSYRSPLGNSGEKPGSYRSQVVNIGEGPRSFRSRVGNIGERPSLGPPTDHELESEQVSVAAQIPRTCSS